ncbi:MAG: 4Fe-4S binding protein [Desulfobacteraceae bacterium]|nr:4Fe-4S binding protein [Desulfobacteraceae bacterium]
MKTMRKIIEIDDELCDGCGQCVPSCAEGAIQIVDGKARIMADNLCDGLGACMGDCPNGALKIIERNADEFDEEAVEKYLAQTPEKNTEKAEEALMACGCSSQHIQTLAPSNTIKCNVDEVSMTANQSSNQSPNQSSTLSNWPVQIRLIPPQAPFLKNADLLITADCAAVAYPNLHSSLLPGKIVMMGCPKFDDIEEYIEKFTAIFSTANIKSLTIVLMEVPCCSGLPGIVKKSIEAAKADIPITEIILSARGEILSETGSSYATQNM